MHLFLLLKNYDTFDFLFLIPRPLRCLHLPVSSQDSRRNPPDFDNIFLRPLSNSLRRNSIGFVLGNCGNQSV